MAPTAIEPGILTETTEATVLLVDDDHGVRQVLGRMVSLLGFRAVAVGSAEEALAVASSESVRVVVCDVALPRLNGYELARRLTEDATNVPVLFISGYPREALAERYGDCGDAPHLEKPFAFAALATAIAELVAPEQLAA